MRRRVVVVEYRWLHCKREGQILPLCLRFFFFFLYSCYRSTLKLMSFPDPNLVDSFFRVLSSPWRPRRSRPYVDPIFNCAHKPTPTPTYRPRLINESKGGFIYPCTTNRFYSVSDIVLSKIYSSGNDRFRFCKWSTCVFKEKIESPVGKHKRFQRTSDHIYLTPPGVKSLLSWV